MSFPSYPSYKPSGIPWAVELPRDWHHASLRWLCRRYAGGTPNRENPSFWEDGTIPWLNSGAVNQRLITQPSEFISDAGLQGSSARWVPEGALVLALAGQGKTKGMVAQTAFATTCNQSMAAIVPSSVLRPRYLYWWLEANYQNIRNLGGGDLRDGLNLEMLGSIACPIPPDADQAAIAAFLDRETAKIDALVAEQERLVELLKEKRQAVISHAVTKGLKTDAPMKPSGVEWLGEIPASWDVIHSRRLFRARNEPARTDDEQLTASQKYGMLPQKEFMEREGRGVVQIITGTDSLRHVEPDDFVISLRSFQGGLEWCRQAGAITFHYVALVPQKYVLPEYFAFLFKSTVYIQALRATANLIRDGQDLRYSHFVQVPLPVVPLAEQKAIADFLVAETQRFDAASETARQAIGLLSGRRAALISAAVTGQIDVRSSAEGPAA